MCSVRERPLCHQRSDELETTKAQIASKTKKASELEQQYNRELGGIQGCQHHVRHTHSLLHAEILEALRKKDEAVKLHEREIRDLQQQKVVLQEEKDKVQSLIEIEYTGNAPATVTAHGHSRQQQHGMTVFVRLCARIGRGAAHNGW